MQSCANCMTPFEEKSSRIISIVSTWQDKGSRECPSAPEIISVCEALSMVFEIPPLMSTNLRVSSMSTKRDLFKLGSKFTDKLNRGKEGKEMQKGEDPCEGYALCSCCSETLTLLYNCLQDFTAVCKLGSDIGKILKELEQSSTNSSSICEFSAGEGLEEKLAAPEPECNKKDIPMIKVEPVDNDSSNDENQYDCDDDPASPLGNVSLTDVRSCVKKPCAESTNSDDEGHGNEDSLPYSCSIASAEDAFGDEHEKLQDSETGKLHVVQSKSLEEEPILQPMRVLRPRRNITKKKSSDFVKNPLSDDSDTEEVRFPSSSKKRKPRPDDSDDEYVPDDSDDEYVPEEIPRKYIANEFPKPAQFLPQFSRKLNQLPNNLNIVQFSCPKCRKQFLHESTLICHRRIVHRENIALTPVSIPALFIQRSNSQLKTIAEIAGKKSTCPVCRVEFPRSEIRAHLASHTRSLNKPWLCTICGKNCISNADLLEHVKKHRNSVLCKRCGSKVPQLALLQHARVCLKLVKSYPCNTCGKKFTSCVQLMEHRSLAHGHVWKCKLCGSKFSRRTKMIEHMLTHRKKKAYKCKICDKQFDRIDALRLHVKRFHRNDGPPSVFRDEPVETGEDNGVSTSNTIAETGDTPSGEHSQDDASVLTPIYEDRHICKVCNLGFRVFNLLEIHLLKTHSDAESFGCLICNRKFQDKYCLKLHMKMHSEMKPYSCFICSKTYKEKNTFFYHIKDAHNISAELIAQKYPDLFCLKKSPSRPSERKRKPRVKMPKRPIEKGEYPCEICGKIFPSPISVKLHIKVVHDKIKDFICSYCGKGFARKSYFLIHERLHTSTETPYKCHLCGKGFRMPGTLRMHLKSTIHNTKRDFVCETCGKGFNRVDNLRLHAKAVHMKIQIRKPRSTNTGPKRRRKLLLVESDSDDNKYVPNIPIPGPSFLINQQPAQSANHLKNMESNSENSNLTNRSSISVQQYHNTRSQRAQLANLTIPNLYDSENAPAVEQFGHPSSHIWSNF